MYLHIYILNLRTAVFYIYIYIFVFVSDITCPNIWSCGLSSAESTMVIHGHVFITRHQMNGLAFGQAMSELWEEDETLRRALPWKALTLQAPQKEMRCLQQDVRLKEAQRYTEYVYKYK